MISLPQGVFANVTASGPGPKTCLLFFDKTRKTQNIWYYRLKEPKPSYSKANPIDDVDLVDCFSKWVRKDVSENSWIIPVKEIVENSYNMIPKQLLVGEKRTSHLLRDLIQELELREQEMKVNVDKIKKLLE